MSEAQTQTQLGRLAFSWIVVTVPLLYGVVQTILRATQLFIG